MEDEFVVEKHPVDEIPVVGVDNTPAPQLSPEPVPEPVKEGIALELSRQGWPNNDYQPITEPQPRKSHRGLWVTLAIILVILAALGIFGFTQYKAAMRVVDQLTADGEAVSASVQTIADSVQKMDFATALGSAKDLEATVEHMRALISTREFDVASRIPKYGGDVTTAREMLDIVLNADTEAVIPLLQALTDHPLASLLGDDGVDAAGVYALLDAYDAAMPVIEKDLDALEALPPFVIPQLAEATQSVFDALPSLRATLAELKAKVETVRPLLETFVGRDGSGLVGQLWPLIRLFIGGDGTDFFTGLESFLGLMTGTESEGGGLEGILPLLGLLMGEDTTENSGGSSDAGDDGSFLDVILPFLGLLFDDGAGDGTEAAPDESGNGSDDDFFSLLTPFLGLFTESIGGTDDGSGEGDVGFDDLLPLLGLLLGEDAA